MLSSVYQAELRTDHFLADPVAMWHVRAEIAPAVLMVVDFGGWYRVDAKSSVNTSEVIHHTQVSLLKDVIVPYTHLLPKLLLSEDQERKTLLYFKGAKHRHRVIFFCFYALETFSFKVSTILYGYRLFVWFCLGRQLWKSVYISSRKLPLWK